MTRSMYSPFRVHRPREWDMCASVQSGRLACLGRQWADGEQERTVYNIAMIQ